MYSTRTATYTVVDIRKTFEGFEADLRMIARRTDKWTMSYVEELAHDIIRLAENKYLSEISVALKDSNGRVIKATKFIVNSDGTSMSGNRAGQNDWKDIAKTSLIGILSYTDKWQELSDAEKRKFRDDNNFNINWTTSTIDTSFSHLSKSDAQLYASNGYELKKHNYN